MAATAGILDRNFEFGASGSGAAVLHCQTRYRAVVGQAAVRLHLSGALVTLGRRVWSPGYMGRK